jgi:multidrug resistance efflux pump
MTKSTGSILADEGRPEGQGAGTGPRSTLNSRRKLGLAIVAGAFVAIGAAYGVYWGTVLRYSQSTDDAYVNGNVVQITP